MSSMMEELKKRCALAETARKEWKDTCCAERAERALMPHYDSLQRQVDELQVHCAELEKRCALAETARKEWKDTCCAERAERALMRFV
jgi:SUMO ligase MMS21 Smc5/6 complex component